MRDSERGWIYLQLRFFPGSLCIIFPVRSQSCMLRSCIRTYIYRDSIGFSFRILPDIAIPNQDPKEFLDGFPGMLLILLNNQNITQVPGARTNSFHQTNLPSNSAGPTPTIIIEMGREAA